MPFRSLLCSQVQIIYYFLNELVGVIHHWELRLQSNGKDSANDDNDRRYQLEHEWPEDGNEVRWCRQRRKIKEPSTTPTARVTIFPRPRIVAPINSEASAIVTIPEPMSMLTDFWYWASRQPDKPVNALATQRPTMVVKTVLIEEDFTMIGLFPVATDWQDKTSTKKQCQQRNDKNNCN